MRQRLLELDAEYTSRLRVVDQPGLLRSLAALLAHSGDSWFWLIGLGCVWWLGNEEWKSLAVVMGASLLLTAALVLVIKFSVRRKRPHGEWGEIYRRTDPHSFPSGHAARAALLAVIALGLGPAWFGILLLIWAPLVILARVSMGVHYLSDVLAGALLGGIIGLVVVKIIPLLASAA
jgi:undecaprenyl-diphosphatase